MSRVDEAILEVLRRDRTIDITTTGRTSGRPQRIEIWAWLTDGNVYLTGTPGRRDWYANLKANPEFTLHLKRGVEADLRVRARPVEDPEERRVAFSRLLSGADKIEAWTAGSPLVEVEFS